MDLSVDLCLKIRYGGMEFLNILSQRDSKSRNTLQCCMLVWTDWCQEAAPVVFEDYYLFKQFGEAAFG